MAVQDIAAYVGLALWGSRLVWLLAHPVGGERAAGQRTPPPTVDDSAGGVLLAAPPNTEHLAAAAVQRHFGPALGRSESPWPKERLLVVVRGQPPSHVDATPPSALLSVVLPGKRSGTPSTDRPDDTALSPVQKKQPNSKRSSS